ncbi:hypothetical protein FOPE_10854 [Fonsecaea pedrosoi]|nr:hypothetical protein FOPE_10854 [Fonsecaea pedrosoi]
MWIFLQTVFGSVLETLKKMPRNEEEEVKQMQKAETKGKKRMSGRVELAAGDNSQPSWKDQMVHATGLRAVRTGDGRAGPPKVNAEKSERYWLDRWV